jgi:hypothetical protein
VNLMYLCVPASLTCMPKCGSIEDDWNVLNRMPTHGVVACAAMIMGCVKCRQVHEGHWNYFRKCKKEGCMV